MHLTSKLSLFVILVLTFCLLLNGCSSGLSDKLPSAQATLPAGSVEDKVQNTQDKSNASLDSIQGKLQNAVDNMVKTYSFSGSVLVADKNKILLSEAYGMADYSKNKLNTPDTVFRLGSITKQFTAVAILMLQEKGLLNINNTLDMYSKDYPNGKQIKIHNLLTHTSGIEEHTTPELFSHADHYYSPEDLINLFKNKPVKFKPGEKFSYCNSNYILLGYIIERVSGKKYEDFIKENIFDPLGMSSSGYDHNGKDGRLTAVGYESSSNKEAAYIDMSIPYAAGGLITNVEDLYKWDRALYTDKLITKNSREIMFTPFLENYAYGWSISKRSIGGKDCLITEHGGAVNGFSSYISRDINQQNVVIVLSNKENQGWWLRDFIEGIYYTMGS